MRWHGAKLLLGALAACLLSACAGPRLAKSPHRGLFQGDGMPDQQSVAERRGDLPSGFIWPVKVGAVSSPFGKRKRDFHDGIDIQAPRGTPVYAAKDGVVIYSSRRIGGYGNMVVIKHQDRTASVYAHNKKNTVPKGRYVRQGELIAYVGATGRATGPHLHFEIRNGQVAEDPLAYLPPMPPAETVAKVSGAATPGRKTASAERKGRSRRYQ